MLATVSCGLDKEETGLIPGDPLLESLKGKVVNFACRSDVSVTVQMAAQDVLRQGWSVILPTSEERMETLLDLLGDTGNGIFHCFQSDSCRLAVPLENLSSFHVI